ncbi:hypothetical protein [Methanogenium organophilum]|uniref:Uncharacterized protein n=1 Tax=Methanogenium organophilum TaxID=2199 RepID=A0A9X9S1V3_METOG|nr:hypothetical protein [Methanogenium organophilum]WAI00211.1 hypothetical protein OU421_07140 [Methanogenium organophilum]
MSDNLPWFPADVMMAGRYIRVVLPIVYNIFHSRPVSGDTFMWPTHVVFAGCGESHDLANLSAQRK